MSGEARLTETARSTLASAGIHMPGALGGWVMLIVANVCFAGAYVSGKVALRDVSPVTLNALRFTLASLALAPIVVRRRHELVGLSRGGIATLAGVSLCGFVINKLFEYEGLSLSTASDAALLITGEGIFTAALAWLVLRERATWSHVLALLLGFGGAYLIVERGFAPRFLDAGGRLDLRIAGDALFTLSLAFEALASVISKRLTGRLSPLFVTSFAVVGSLAVWVPAGTADIAAHGLHLTLASGGSILFMAAVVTICGYLLWFAGLQRIDGAAAAPTLFLQPLIGTLLAIVILGDQITPYTILGGVCIVAGVAVISRGAGHRANPPEIPGILPADAP